MGLLVNCYPDPGTFGVTVAGYWTTYFVPYLPHLKIGHEQELT